MSTRIEKLMSTSFLLEACLSWQRSFSIRFTERNEFEGLEDVEPQSSKWEAERAKKAKAMNGEELASKNDRSEKKMGVLKRTIARLWKDVRGDRKK